MAIPNIANPSDPSDGQHALLRFLKGQNQASLNRLYGKPSTCLALFRLLRPLERQIIMNHLWLEGAVTSSTMSAWVTREGRREYEAAIQSLTSLHILRTNVDGSKLALAPSFQGSFRNALTGGGDHMSFGVPCQPSPEDNVSVNILDQHASERWESILHFMVSSGTDQRTAKPTKGILFLLERSGLMSGIGAPRITSQGFQFLLNSPHAQLWMLLLEYLQISEERHLDMIEVVQFLLMLSTTQLGQEYATENFTPTHNAMLEDLQDYGLIYQRKYATNRIYPTRLATTLTSSSHNITTSTTASSSSSSQEFIILETNYRLYAYTDNPLHISILNLFAHLKGRFPNLVTGSITRESVKKALDNGITADQIISYLITHAHPQMHKNDPLLPTTVQDQIRIWEQEKNRLHMSDGYVWKEFTSASDYELVASYARELNCILWESPQQRMFFVTADGHTKCREFIGRMQNGGQIR